MASTIDNDLAGTDVSIGTTTAVDIALESVDRLRVTAASHQRGFLVEVMGRDCGYLASVVGLASGAEVIGIPERPSNPEAERQAQPQRLHHAGLHVQGQLGERPGIRRQMLARLSRVHAPNRTRQVLLALCADASAEPIPPTQG